MTVAHLCQQSVLISLWNLAHPIFEIRKINSGCHDETLGIVATKVSNVTT